MASLLTSALVKTMVGLEADDDTYDAAIARALPLVTSWFEGYCDRGLARRVITDEEVFFNEGNRIYVWCFPIVSLLSVDVGGDVVLGDSYVVNKNAGYIFGGYGRPYTEYSRRIVLSYTGGYAPEDVPADLAYAFATAIGVQAAVAGVASSSGGSSAIKSIGLGGGALSVAFDTGKVVGGTSGSYDVANVPTEVQNYASVLDRYVRQRV